MHDIIQFNLFDKGTFTLCNLSFMQLLLRHHGVNIVRQAADSPCDLPGNGQKCCKMGWKIRLILYSLCKTSCTKYHL